MVILGFGRVGRMVADMLKAHTKDSVGDGPRSVIVRVPEEGYDARRRQPAGLIEQLRERSPSAFI